MRQRHIVCPECGMVLSVVEEPKTVILEPDHRLVCLACGKGMVLFPNSEMACRFRVEYAKRKAADNAIKELLAREVKCKGAAK